MLKYNILLLGLVLLLTQTISTAALNCMQCDSSTDVNCIQNVAAVTTTKDCQDTEQCFVMLSNDKVTRGCMAAADCKDNNCITCSDNNCNKHNICKSCNSNTDAACAQSDAKSVKNAICAAADTKCIMRIGANKETIRDCATAETEKSCNDVKDGTCQTCSAGTCNTGIFPNNRRSCYQCTVDSCADVSSNNAATKSCLLYEANDSCYMSAANETHVTRGCVSDASNNACTANSNDASCLRCSADNCNVSGYKRKQTIQCVQCSDNTNCPGTQTNKATECKEIIYNQKDLCYTQRKGDTMYRGCFNERSTELGECNAANNCETCGDASGCNSKGETFTCINCRSDLTPGCRNIKTDKISDLEKTCRNGDGVSSSQCFQGVWNNVWIRGCLVDADLQTQAICTDKYEEQCTVCDGKNCNVKDINGATAISITTGLLVAVLLGLWQMR